MKIDINMLIPAGQNKALVRNTDSAGLFSLALVHRLTDAFIPVQAENIGKGQRVAGNRDLPDQEEDALDVFPENACSSEIACMVPSVQLPAVPEAEWSASPDNNPDLSAITVQSAYTGYTLPSAGTPDIQENMSAPHWMLQQLVNKTPPARFSQQAVPVSADNLVSPQSGTEKHLPGFPDLAGIADAVFSDAGTRNGITQTLSDQEISNSATLSVQAGSPVAATQRTLSASGLSQSVIVSHAPDSPEWKQSVSQHIALFCREGIQHASIRLHPEDLGALQITLKLSGEQAHLHIVSEHAHVRQAMEHAMPQLRSAMAESGIQLGQTSVSADNPFNEDGTHQEKHANQEPGKNPQQNVAEEEIIVSALADASSAQEYGINTFA